MAVILATSCITFSLMFGYVDAISRDPDLNPSEFRPSTNLDTSKMSSRHCIGTQSLIWSGEKSLIIYCKRDRSDYIYIKGYDAVLVHKLFS